MTIKALVTGSAGFIGYHLCKHLLELGYEVVGVDALTEYYDPQLKIDRLSILNKYQLFTNHQIRIENEKKLGDVFAISQPDFVIHLAAQAGVRYSIEAPSEYVQTNLIGTFNILELSKIHSVSHLLMASTSSVYGANEAMPFTETQKTETPMSFYAATKKSNELMAHSYSHIFELPVTMFRFFTVYGPWGRPDMALFKFIEAIENNRPIDIYNYGKMKRDFTFVEDLVVSIAQLISCVPSTSTDRGSKQSIQNDSLSPVAPHRVVNIGNSSPTDLMDYVAALESALGVTAKKNMMPIQPGDVPATWADNELLCALTGNTPSTPVKVGVHAFVDWYKSYNNGKGAKHE
ncbi:NAD-dependent epimerase/dehydratase family protein [Paracoccaceae bacterium]|nr:NAD-dependent epimerase/dehydratase family protein [Paracoccaceae bacterium]